MGGRPPSDFGHFIGVVDGPGGVGGGNEDHRLGAGGAGRLQLVDGHFETARGVGGDGNRLSPRQTDRLRVGDPVGGRQQHLVALVHQALHPGVDRLFASVGDQHLRGLRRQSGMAPGLLRHRLPQLRQPGGRSVFVHGRVAGRLHRRFHDGGRSGKIRLPRPEPDHRPPLGPHLPGLGGDGHGGRLGDVGYPLRNAPRVGHWLASRPLSAYS